MGSSAAAGEGGGVFCRLREQSRKHLLYSNVVNFGVTQRNRANVNVVMPSHRIVGQDTSPVIYADSVSVSVFVLVVWMLLSDNKTVRLGA